MNLNEQLQRQKSYLHHHGPISIQQRLKALMQLKQAIKQYETELEEANRDVKEKGLPRVRTLYKPDFLRALRTHDAEIAFVVAVAQRLCTIQNGSLQFIGVVIHLAEILRHLFAAFLFGQLADCTLFVRYEELILAGNLFKIEKPVHRILIDVVAAPFGLFSLAAHILRGEGALSLLVHHHDGAE